MKMTQEDIRVCGAARRRNINESAKLLQNAIMALGVQPPWKTSFDGVERALESLEKEVRLYEAWCLEARTHLHG